MDNSYYRNIGTDAVAELKNKEAKANVYSEALAAIEEGLDPNSFSSEEEYNAAIADSLIKQFGDEITSMSPEEQEANFGFVLGDYSAVNSGPNKADLQRYAEDPDDIADAEMKEGDYQTMMKMRNDTMLDKTHPASKDLRSQMLMRRRGVTR